MKRKYYLLGVQLAFVAVGVYMGVALNHDKKLQAEPEKETESPVVQFKVQYGCFGLTHRWKMW